MTAFDHARLDELAATLGEQARATLLRRFLAELAEQPGEIAAALATGQTDTVREIAHYLRGAALTVGAADVAMASERLERSPDAALVDHADALAASAASTHDTLTRVIGAGLV